MVPAFSLPFRMLTFYSTRSPSLLFSAQTLRWSSWRCLRPGHRTLERRRRGKGGSCEPAAGGRDAGPAAPPLRWERPRPGPWKAVFPNRHTPLPPRQSFLGNTTEHPLPYSLENQRCQAGAPAPKHVPPASFGQKAPAPLVPAGRPSGGSGSELGESGEGRPNPGRCSKARQGPNCC